MSSETHQSASFPFLPPSPPPVDSPLRPHLQLLHFKELVSDFFIHDTATPPDPLYMHLPITSLGTSHIIHTMSSHLDLNSSIMETIPSPAVPLPHCCSPNAPQFNPCNHSTLAVYLANYELAAKVVHLTPADKLSQSTGEAGEGGLGKLSQVPGHAP